MGLASSAVLCRRSATPKSYPEQCPSLKNDEKKRREKSTLQEKKKKRGRRDPDVSGPDRLIDVYKGRNSEKATFLIRSSKGGNERS